jgi:CDP-paratose 2-epimerase
VSLKAFVTGGAGFIGTNLAARIQDRGGHPVVFDDLSRPGSETNLEWLKGRGEITFVRGDVRNPVAVSEALRRHRDSGAIFHLAAQVAVTTSLADPRHDFEVNALGTFNVLEAARAHAPRTPFIFASTNKVYGSLEDLAVEDTGKRYVLRDRPAGVAEDRGLDFHSPYGCSKGAADQYVVDYSRIYGLPTVAFRQSCIYGRRQMGVEDQGWVAWFLIAAVSGRPITIYGDGKQVRDILFCDDLVALYLAAVDRIEAVRGRAYNVGGGPTNTLSLLELLGAMDELGLRPDVKYAGTRPGDQKVFVADIGAARRDLEWTPKVDPRTGVRELARWIEENLPVLQEAGV